MKTPSRLTVILSGTCAMIWTVSSISEIIYCTYHDSVFLFVLNLLCTVIWIGAFVVDLKRYRSNKGD